MADQSEAIFDDTELREFYKSLERKGLTLERGSKQLGGIIGANVYRDIMAHFDQEQGPGGEQWVSWSSIYADHMDKIGKGGNKILQDTGRLRNSFRPGSFNVVPGGVLFFNPAKTKGGFPYAAAHDEGGKRLPQRKFMWLSEIAKEEIAEQALKWMLDER